MPITNEVNAALAAPASRVLAAEVERVIAEQGDGNASEIARRMGTSMSQLSRLRTGEADTRLTTLAGLAAVQGKSLSAFLTEFATAVALAEGEANARRKRPRRRR